MLKNFFILNLLALLLFCCAKKEDDSITITAPSDEEISEIYKEGYEALAEGDGGFAAKKFAEAESLYPQSTMAAKSSLMRSYSFYTINIIQKDNTPNTMDVDIKFSLNYLLSLHIFFHLFHHLP